MTINPLIPGFQEARRNGDLFTGIRTTLNDLQRQIASGKKSETYGGLGNERRTSLDVRFRLDTIAGYDTVIKDAELRVKILSQSTERLAKMALETKSDSSPSAFNPSVNGRTPGQDIAREKIKMAIDVFNTQINGRYLFSGRSADVKPVADYNVLLNGDGQRAGILQLISERRQADLGVTGQGRTVVGGAGASASLTEEAANLPYGFDITGGGTNNTNITAAFSAGPPAAVNFNVASLPVEGDQVSVSLQLPDGTNETITLSAKNTVTGGASFNAFQIGASTAATGANLRSALTIAIQEKANSALSAASSIVAAGQFFAGSNSAPPLRVPGPPYNTATLPPAAGTAANTVIWYQGDDSAPSARQTAAVKVGESQTIGAGAQANEGAFRQLLTQLVAFSSDSFPSSDANAQSRYSAFSTRLRENLTDSGANAIKDISIEFGQASAVINTAKEWHLVQKGLLQETLAGVEDANIEQASASLLSLQTRLQATYQTTSIISQLSLTKYL
jgi:flagellar hook-associated protein 3 FlgL